jgi:ferrous iron transport protein A
MSVVLVASSAERRRALRLAELGLRPGSRLTVLSRTSGGGRVVGVGHARIALGRALARHLHVAPETG